jgi:hypothetical protein
MKRTGHKGKTSLTHNHEFIYTRDPVPPQVDWYKWEFLRRNEEYKADYDKFLEQFGGWFENRGFWYDEGRRLKHWSKSDEDYFYDNIAPVIGEICGKWQVANLFPPSWRFPKNGQGKKIGSRELGPPTGLAPELNWDLTYMRELLELGFTGSANSAYRYGNFVQIEFDLNRQMKDLVQYAKYVLQRAMENYIAELGERGIRLPRARRRLKDYDTHLKIWDLKRKNKSVSTIAKLAFPNEQKDSSLQKVQDHLRAANKLISGGYKEIR